MTAKRLIGFLLLFLVFTTLLTCYQLIGNNVLEAFSVKRPVVWLGMEPAGTAFGGTGAGALALALSNESFRSESVSAPVANFDVIVPPDADRLFTVNGAPVSPLFSGAAILRFPGVKLREGENTVQASIQGRNLSQSETATLEVMYVPAKSSYPFTITEPYVDAADGHLRVTVMTPPASGSINFQAGDGPPVNAYGIAGIATADLGVPGSATWYFMPDPVHREARWRIWPLPVEPGEKSGSGGTNPLPVAVQTAAMRPAMSMNIDVQANVLTMEGHLTIPPGSALLDWALHKEILPVEVLNRIFGLELNAWYGLTSVNSREYAQMEPYLRWGGNFTNGLSLSSVTNSPIESRLEVNGSDLQLHVRMPVPSTGLAVSNFDEGTLPYTVAVKAADRSRVDFPGPARWNGDVANIEAGTPGIVPLVVIHGSGTPAAAGSKADDEDEDREWKGRVLDYLRNLQRTIPRFVTTIIYALLGAVPFLWAIQLVRNSGLRRRRVREITAACLVLLVLHFTIQSAGIFRVSLQQFQLAELLHRPELGWRLTALGSYYPFLAIGMVILLGPIFGTYRRGPRGSASAWRSVAQGAVLMVSLAVAMGVTVYISFGLMTHDRVDTERMPQLAAAAGVVAAMLLFWIPLRLCLVFLLGVSVPMRAVFGANLAMLALPALPSIFGFFLRSLIALYVNAFAIFPAFIPWQSSRGWWRWIVAGLGALLLYQVTKLCLYMSYWKPAMRFTGRKRVRWLILLFMIAAIPAWYAGGASTSAGRSPDVYDFSNFAANFDALLPYVIVPVLIAVMRMVNRNDDYRLSATIISCGSLLFAYYLCGQAVVVLFIPVPMLAGYFLFRRFLVLRTAPVGAGAVPAVADFVKKQWDAALANQRKKALDKKFGSGDLTYSKYRRSVAQLKAAFGLDDRFRVDEPVPGVFSTGAGGGPWRDAEIALRYGIPLSLPFQLMAMVRILRAPAGDFPVIFLFVEAMRTMVLWVLIAFVFGYFYHAIRGGNGFQKALSFFIAFSIPTVLIQFTVETQTLNRGQLIELVQLAAFLLALALLAFDVKVLRVGGYSWRDLPVAYGVTTSAAYLGTLALSLVSTVAEPMLKDWLVKLFGH